MIFYQAHGYPDIAALNALDEMVPPSAPAFVHAILYQNLPVIYLYNSRNCGCDNHCVIVMMSHTSSLALLDDQGVIAQSRHDFMGGAEEAANSVYMCLYPDITFRKHCVEQSGE